ncbi:unnamed protein product [Macrosiphum euphorbiae]|uniref:Uncharacterized protein n=1 Tax=Macrosiphum euphorbiae TaxID=13131 RepID=A0AAV0W5X4_9HEMI|nr:unnamed protein product [Macrosiphum euphorbiae]
MAANELASNFDETELKNVINQLIEDIINTLIINISTEETCSVDDSGREPTLPGGDEDFTTLSYAPIIVVKDRSDGDGCTSVEEIETVPAEGREPSHSSGHLSSGLDPGATTLDADDLDFPPRGVESSAWFGCVSGVAAKAFAETLNLPFLNN